MGNEKRLIDAEALWRDLVLAAWYDNADRDEVALPLVSAAPTVAVGGTVRGHWTYKYDPIVDPKRYFVRIVCSVCNLHTGQRSNFCPQCGAKMDGDSG